ncbi:MULTISPECIES: GTP 3',8-cyclase MoaA [Rhodopseudomonas]|uniref:GTP 3',8-cyclase n=1 Tax=Rhodopseudomonas palustris TaxID=1076 RepID=A0A0D7ERH7_RHOPL|nr:MULTISPECIES: GTP 3',8-cyclase MoaA [Rhodopseudomonas]KIZ43165.1 molybdenum cofactor biosynthesis protein A [Rhodopseudomonas palustris]MDF3809530.1 GTP 3',8-cyclase MoaA [Rhodopseudomonas sp. BAL398]WOK19732.1 GTP 3',8-cyclase MoaA [Rhodopseudomonas sp. BAL398]
MLIGPQSLASGTLIDPMGRHIDRLRVSVTDRCNFRCSYCLGAHPKFAPRAELLTLDELDRLCAAFVSCGVRRIRLTGGEPLVRRNLLSFVRALSRHLVSGDLDEITMTTNGALLGRYAGELADAGLSRINVSVDTLDAADFARITVGGDIGVVLAGIEAARSAGLPVKLNTVVQAGVNETAIPALIEYAHARDMDLTLIEVMPMGLFAGKRPASFVSLKQVRADLERQFTLSDVLDRSSGPARYVRVAETGGRLGFITPMSRGFCESCNRVRITSTGQLVPCLGHVEGVDLRAALRGSESEAPLVDAIIAAIAHKPNGHDFAAARVPATVERSMNVTGG